MSRQSVAEDLELLDRKLKQLKLEYEQYFLGSRPREPVLLRSEVQKLVTVYSNQAIQNTALRFKFNNLCARFFAFRRRWDQTQRQIEDGTYERHVFKARLHGRGSSGSTRTRKRAAADGDGEDLFQAYVEARRQCGEDVAGITRERLRSLLDKQEKSIRSRYGCEKVRFRVVVEGGRAKLKASAVRAAEDDA